MKNNIKKKKCKHFCVGKMVKKMVNHMHKKMAPTQTLNIYTHCAVHIPIVTTLCIVLDESRYEQRCNNRVTRNSLYSKLSAGTLNSVTNKQ